MLSIAGREANIIGFLVDSGGSNVKFADSSTPRTMQRLEWIRQAAGERFDTLEFNTTVFDVLMTDDRKSGAEVMGKQYGITGEQLLDTLHFLVGTVDQIVEHIQMWRERFGISYLGLHPRIDIDAFAPVIARLAGK